MHAPRFYMLVCLLARPPRCTCPSPGRRRVRRAEHSRRARGAWGPRSGGGTEQIRADDATYRALQSEAPLRRSLVRHMFIIVDLSESMRDKDFRPSRYVAGLRRVVSNAAGLNSRSNTCVRLSSSGLTRTRLGRWASSSCGTDSQRSSCL